MILIMYHRILATLALVVAVIYVHTVEASVTLLGNRVIYPAGVQEKTLQFSNDDDVPALIQIWLDIDNEHSTPATADAPFMATPQVFKMAPHSGQMVRLIFTGRPQPTDRESLFYLNYLQVPALKQSDSSHNRLMLQISHRLKVFYRPEGLPGDAQQAANQLTYSVQGRTVKVQNPTPYYVSASGASLETANRRIEVAGVTMIAPFSQADWHVSETVQDAHARLIVEYTNDFGASASSTLAPIAR